MFSAYMRESHNNSPSVTPARGLKTHLAKVQEAAARRGGVSGSTGGGSDAGNVGNTQESDAGGEEDENPLVALCNSGVFDVRMDSAAMAVSLDTDDYLQRDIDSLCEATINVPDPPPAPPTDERLPSSSLHDPVTPLPSQSRIIPSVPNPVRTRREGDIFPVIDNFTYAYQHLIRSLLFLQLCSCPASDIRWAYADSPSIYITRLVVQEFSRVPFVTCGGTFVPVSKAITIRFVTIDICGPFPVTTPHDKTYYVLFFGQNLALRDAWWILKANSINSVFFSIDDYSARVERPHLDVTNMPDSPRNHTNIVYLEHLDMESSPGSVCTIPRSSHFQTAPSTPKAEKKIREAAARRGGGEGGVGMGGSDAGGEGDENPFVALCNNGVTLWSIGSDVRMNPCAGETEKRADAVEWRKETDKELGDLKRMGVYEDVDELPEGKKAIGCRWVYEFKIDESGGFPTYKVHLVAGSLRGLWGNACSRCQIRHCSIGRHSFRLMFRRHSCFPVGSHRCHLHAPTSSFAARFMAAS